MKKDSEKGVERRKDGEEKGEGKERISGVHIHFLAPGAAACFSGLWPVLYFQFGLFESINLPPVWAPIKEAALQSLHSAVASCRLSFLFTTDFVCLSPLSPILGTLWTETEHPPSPEQGLAPALEFQEISKVVSGQQQQQASNCMHHPALCKQRAVPHQHSHPVKFKSLSQTGVELLYQSPSFSFQNGIYTSTLPIQAARRHQDTRASCSALWCVQGVQLHTATDSGAPTARCATTMTQISSTSTTCLMSGWAPLPSLAAVQPGLCLHASVEVPLLTPATHRFMLREEDLCRCERECYLTH